MLGLKKRVPKATPPEPKGGIAPLAKKTTNKVATLCMDEDTIVADANATPYSAAWLKAKGYL